MKTLSSMAMTVILVSSFITGTAQAAYKVKRSQPVAVEHPQNPPAMNWAKTFLEHTMRDGG